LSGSAFALNSNTLDFYSACESMGGWVKTHVWRLPVYIVTDPELIEEVLVRKHRYFIKSAGLRATKRGFGQGLLTSDRDLWRQQRRIVQPAFQAHRVEQYGPIIQQATDRILASFGSGGERNIHRDMTDLCFETLTLSLFGEDLMRDRELVARAADALHGFHSQYSEWIGSFGGLFFAAFRAISTALGRPDFVVDPARMPTPYARRFRKTVDDLDQAVTTLIRRRRAQPAGSDLIGLLLAARDEAGQPLTERQIRDEVRTMFFAGHETGAAALTWAFYLLAKHPEVANELANEIECGSGDELMDQVMREAMRLYPPAYRISRTVIRTCRAGYATFEAGAEVIIPQWSVHRSNRYYDEPDEFRPRRWTPDFISRLPRFAYFPFGGGPRTCIGNTFGLSENKLVIARVLSRFEFAVPEHKPDLQLGVTLLPRDNSLKLKLSPRRGVRPGGQPLQAARKASACPFHSSATN
jgi:cytochrome P450